MLELAIRSRALEMIRAREADRYPVARQAPRQAASKSTMALDELLQIVDAFVHQVLKTVSDRFRLSAFVSVHFRFPRLDPSRLTV